MNDIFAQNAWYFRNALVRANYNDLVNDVHETTEYLELFLKNLLLGEKNELHNRTMHISGKFKKPSKQNIDKIKQNIFPQTKPFAVKIPYKKHQKNRQWKFPIYECSGKIRLYNRFHLYPPVVHLTYAFQGFCIIIIVGRISGILLIILYLYRTLPARNNLCHSRFMIFSYNNLAKCQFLYLICRI